MARKRRKIKRSWLIILTLSVLLILSLSLILNNPKFIGKKSVHADAKKYQTRHCLAFYPDGDNGLKMAKEVCKDVKDDSIFDYSLIPFGDYYMVNYGHDLRYLTDKEYNTLKIETISEKEKGIITDYHKLLQSIFISAFAYFLLFSFILNFYHLFSISSLFRR